MNYTANGHNLNFSRNSRAIFTLVDTDLPSTKSQFCCRGQYKWIGDEYPREAFRDLVHLVDLQEARILAPSDVVDSIPEGGDGEDPAQYLACLPAALQQRLLAAFRCAEDQFYGCALVWGDYLVAAVGEDQGIVALVEDQAGGGDRAELLDEVGAHALHELWEVDQSDGTGGVSRLVFQTSFFQKILQQEIAAHDVYVEGFQVALLDQAAENADQAAAIPGEFQQLHLALICGPFFLQDDVSSQMLVLPHGQHFVRTVHDVAREGVVEIGEGAEPANRFALVETGESGNLL